MKYINLYFFIKIFLYYRGNINFDWLLNLGLAGISFWPLSINRWIKVRSAVVWVLAFLLFYYDSYLPGVARIFSRMDALSGFTTEYIFDLLGRLYSPVIFIGFFLSIIIFIFLNNRLRLSSFVIVGILSVPMVSALNFNKFNDTAKADTTAEIMRPQKNQVSGAMTIDYQVELSNFYAQESQRHVSFSTGGQVPSFDIVLMHVCSISWDDLDFVNERNHPLLKKFDIIFSQFNTAASYSGPAAIRLLRGSCGQTPHEKLYQNVDPRCYIFPSLEKIGYLTKGLINHDGIYDRYLHVLEAHTGLKGKLEKYSGVPVALQSFAGSPIYDDFSLLSKWWESRLTRTEVPEALYYQTITLHDGNSVLGANGRKSLMAYKPRLIKFLSDLDKFISLIEKSGKPVVLMLVPEHGASLRGDKYQISGMREIPTPGITIGPAGIKLIGLNKKNDLNPILISNQVSFFDIYGLLSNLLLVNPYSDSAPSLSSRVKNIGKTKLVSENDDVIMMMDSKGGYVMKSSRGAWVPYH